MSEKMTQVIVLLVLSSIPLAAYSWLLWRERKILKKDDSCHCHSCYHEEYLEDCDCCSCECKKHCTCSCNCYCHNEAECTCKSNLNFDLECGSCGKPLDDCVCHCKHKH